MVLGHLMGIELRARPSALASTVFLGLGLASAARPAFRLSPGAAVAAGLMATLLHWTSETMHQMGHAVAARRTGYPMTGIVYGPLLATSRYPADEPELPAAIHIRRALGGPPVSLGLAGLGGLAAWGLRRRQGLPYLLSLWFTFENLVVFGLGAFLPLGFTDGSTLLQWWGKE